MKKVLSIILALCSFYAYSDTNQTMYRENCTPCTEPTPYQHQLDKESQWILGQYNLTLTSRDYCMAKTTEVVIFRTIALRVVPPQQKYVFVTLLYNSDTGFSVTEKNSEWVTCVPMVILEICLALILVFLLYLYINHRDVFPF